jgi:hypothetical protein
MRHLDRFVLLVVSLFMLGMCAPSSQADVVSPELSAYSVYSEGDITMNGRATVSGYLGADGSLSLQDDTQISQGVFSGGPMSLRYRIQVEGLVHSDSTMYIYDDTILRDSVQSAGNMTLRYRVQISGDATSEGSITSMDGVSVGGTTSQYGTLPHSWTAPVVTEPVFTPGVTNVYVDYNMSQTLLPGAHGDLTLKAGSSVSLSTGVYHFKSISSESDVRFLIDDAAGPVEVYVEQNMLAGYRANIVLDSGDGTNLEWFVGGTLTLQADTQFVGSVQCFSSVTLQDRITTSGSIYAKTGFSCGWDCVFGVATSRVFYVATNGNDANRGTSMSAPLRTIQAAVNKCSVEGSIVYIAPGTYNERVQIGMGSGSAAPSGTESEPVRVIGDVDGTNTNRNPGSIVLNGSGQYERGIELQDIDYWEFDGVSITGFTQYGLFATRSGFAFENATIDVPPTYAIYATIDADTRINGVRFDRDDTSGSAAWVQCVSMTGDTDLEFSSNDMTLRDEKYLSRAYAQGISRQSSDQSGVSGSSSGYRASYGLIAYGSQNGQWGTVTISNNLFSDMFIPVLCYAYQSSSDVRIVNNTISGSMYSIYAQAYNGSSALRVNNNIVDQCYYGVMTSTSGSSTISVSGLLEHRITYNMSAYGRAYEFDIITENPLFSDPAAGDYSLCIRSPAVDAGTMRYAPSTDFDGFSRPQDGDEDGIAQVDLGACEQIGECPPQVRVVQWREIGDESNE